MFYRKQKLTEMGNGLFSQGFAITPTTALAAPGLNGYRIAAS